MDPTTAIPFHFTLQALAVAGAGLLVAWSLVRMRWIAAIGAGLLGAGEALHAGGYLATDDDPALVLLRFAGLVLLAGVAVFAGPRRVLYVAGVTAVAAGALWGALEGGGIADPAIGPHLFIASGSVLLAAWAWLASRDSIRLRVLTALVGMLAIVFIAGGGAVSRVAALDKRNEQLRELGSAATAALSDLDTSWRDLERRAALVPALVAPSFDADEKTLASVAASALQGRENEAVAVVDRDRVRMMVSSGARTPAYGRDDVLHSSAVRTALGERPGGTTTAFDVKRRQLVIISAAPVRRPGSREIVGAIAIVQMRSADDLRRAARTYAPDAEVVILGRTVAASDRSLLGINPRGNVLEDVVFERVDAPDGTRPAATTTFSPDLRIVLVGSDEGAVDAATGLLRALLLAILAAGALAVVIALWLSARLTRPIVDLAEGAERVKTDFLSSLSHELRTPLTPIRGYTEILRRGRVPSRRAADYLDEIGQAAGRLERIVTLLIDVAAQEAGRFHVAPREVRPDEMLAEAADRWVHDSRRHPIGVTAPRSLPRVHADPDVLARALDELIDNAIKFSPQGNRIELRARRTRDGVEFSVTDKGIGIPADQLGELTGAFAQAESGDRRRYGGLGLGLAFVSGVLDAHASRLSVTSEPGAGTTFSFTVPTAGMVSRMPARVAQRGWKPEAGNR